jgi:hypothetical protein
MEIYLWKFLAACWIYFPICMKMFQDRSTNPETLCNSSVLYFSNVMNSLEVRNLITAVFIFQVRACLIQY